MDTPARTHSISGLKSRVTNLTFLALKMKVNSGLEFILKFAQPLQRDLLTCQANSATLKGLGEFLKKIKKSGPLFTIILSQKCKFQDSRFYSTYRMSPSWCVEALQGPVWTTDTIDALQA